MSPLANTKWEFVDYHDKGHLLGYIRCSVTYRGMKFDYNFTISKDYVLMRQREDYLWYLLSYMSRELVECLT